MKRFAIFSVMLSIVLGSMSCDAQTKKTPKATKEVSSKVEVYYFHYTRRCITCNAVEEVTRKSLAEMYPEQQKSGKITFTSVNLDDENSKTIAKKCQAEGQALLVVSNAQRVDLTDKGFMYARSKPEKLKEEIKNEIDPLL